MKTVWKYPVRPTMEIELPVGAQVLSVQMQGGEPQMWVHLDPAAPKEVRSFAVFGTGHEIPDDYTLFIGTFQTHGGLLVFHVFETRDVSAKLSKDEG